jgi:murein DD-endopeptidase MepM/ murein hydrolase activator NlpD
MANRPRIRLLIAILIALGLLIALVWWLSKRPQTKPVAVVTLPQAEGSPSVAAVAEPSLAVPAPQPSVESTIAPPPEPVTDSSNTAQPTGTPPASAAAPSESGSLLVPVAGVRPDQLRDTFQAARSEGRVHDAIDIPAPRGTPVLAATDGRIVKLFESVPGGTTIYQLGADNKSIYYYAHLDRYAEGVREGNVVRRGEVIAYVGDTGNAGAGNYHLHFSVSIVSDPKRYWQGTNVNPYPLLTGRPK